MRSLRFLWERAKRRKIGIFFLIIGVVLWFLLPNGIDDFLVMIPFISIFGLKTYILVVSVLLFVFLGNGKVRSLFKRATISELRSICDKKSRTEQEFRRCVMKNG